jgi:uncharacterized membrane protein YkvA (DUF1232 family)
MKVSSADIKLTEQDVLEIIEEYVDINGLSIESISIGDIITLRGKYNKKVDIPFEIEMGIGNVKDGFLNLKVYKLNIYKFGMLNIIKKNVIKKVIEDFTDYGVELNGDIVTIDLDRVKKLIPYVNFNIKAIEVFQGFFKVQVENIVYKKDKEIPHVEKKTDKYPHFYNKWYEKFGDYIFLMPDIVILFWKLIKDKRVKGKSKVILGNALLYLVSPVDLIPGFIPVLGQIDDIVAAFLVLNIVLDEIPENIVLENWSGKGNIILITKKVKKYISEIIGGDKIITKNQYRKMHSADNLK